jgi:hypothetical protein
MKSWIIPMTIALVTWLVLAPAVLAQEDDQDQQIQAEEQEAEQQIEQQFEQQTGLPAEANVELEENTQGNLVPTIGEVTYAVPAQQPQMGPQMGGGATTGPLPKSGGLEAGAMVLPAAALLLGCGVLGYAVLRRR